MDNLYTKLCAALEERLQIISDQTLRSANPELQLEKLKNVSEHIWGIQKELPANTDPQLIHYLQRSSYDKALAFLKQQ